MIYDPCDRPSMPSRERMSCTRTRTHTHTTCTYTVQSYWLVRGIRLSSGNFTSNIIDYNSDTHCERYFILIFCHFLNIKI